MSLISENNKDQVADNLGKWVELLSEKPFPMFPITVNSLYSLNESDVVRSIDRVCSELLLDPGATLAILRKVNSSKRRRLGNQITTVQNAAMMMGIMNLRKLPVDLPELEPPGKTSAESGYLSVTSRAFHAAYQAYEWSIYLGDHMPKEVFTATFLHDLGEMALWLFGHDEMQQIKLLMQQERMPEDEAQYVVLGFSLEQLTHELVTRWNLPLLTKESLEAENTRDRRVLGIMLASQLSRIAERGWYSDEMVECLENVAKYMDMPFEELVPRVHQNALVAAADSKIYGVHPAARWLPMLPGKWPCDEYPDSVKEKINNRIENGEIQTGTEGAAQVVDDKSFQSGAHHFCLTPKIEYFEEVMELIQDSTDKMDLHELIILAIRGLHDGLGLNRVVYSMLNFERTDMEAHHFAGTDNDPKFNQFKISIDTPNLFSHLLKKTQSVWVNDDNRAKMWPMVPDNFKDLIGTDSFYATSICINDKAVGLFYADRHTGDCHLDEGSYQHFKKLCYLTAKTIENLKKS